MSAPVVSVQAHCKLLLHAAKYPHATVNGVLLAEDNKNKESKGVRYVDCIPLFHISLGLSPMLEMALLQIDTYCKSKGLVIGGYYQANENYNDNELNHAAKTIGRKIQENFHEACVLLIDNRRVRAESVCQAYRIFTLKETSWREVDKNVDGYLLHSPAKKSAGTSEEDISKEECLYTLLKSGSQRQLRDFDSHLDDVRNDWRNLELNDIISRCT